MKYPHRLLFAFLSIAILFCANQSASAKDEWLEVHSKNFYLVGNASEKDIRKVATKLEQFRETFRLLFSSANLTSPIQTNVIVFKSDAAFKPFKPRRADGKADNFIAGYFQSGEDVNYIAVSAEGNDAEMYNTIFHEYVHFIVNTNFGESEVPPWFNEGLAEYYSTFAVIDDQKVKLGLPDSGHLYLLQQTKLIPLDQLFQVTNRQLHAQGSHSRSIIYAESWALMHYLILTGKGTSVDKFLSSVLRGTAQDQAFRDAFKMTYAQMESELRRYVGKSTYQYMNITLKNKLSFEADMHAAPYTEAKANAHLGDLLYHTNRADDAEPYLMAALKAEPEMSMANTTLGMVKMRQRKFDEARQYLEKATAGEQKNHLAFYQYAYLLSREGRDDFGYVRDIPIETAEKMRVALKRAIAIAPDFSESYDLLAFVALVRNEHIDEAVTLLQKALKYQPGNERYAMRMAELYMRQNKYDQAQAIATKFGESEDDDIRKRAQQLLSHINERKEFEQRMAEQRKQYETISSGSGLRRRENSEKPMSEEELRKAQEEANVRSLNEALRESKDGEQRVLGTIDKIACKGAAITYMVKTGDGTFSLSSKDFAGLEVNAFVPDANGVAVGCGEDLSSLYAVITYKNGAAVNGAARGELVSLEFVPRSFRLLGKDELERRSPANTAGPSGGGPSVIRSSSAGPADMERSRSDFMMESIRKAVGQPAAGQKRELAFLSKIECTNKGVFFQMKTPSQTLRLLNSKPASLSIRVFAPDLGGAQLGCNAGITDFPAVVVYTDAPDNKLKTAGEIVSLDFVPRNFTLN